jgi:2-dehydro-3-deoxygalactonokinase
MTLPNSATPMIAIDWGTTHLRAYRLAASGDIELRRIAAKGIMSIPPDGFAAALEELLEDWSDLTGPIFMSGMIGSRQGWLEVPYVECPAGLHELAAAVRAAPSSGKRSVRICPGLCCSDGAGVPDVMRGEEVQIFGALSVSGGMESATICLPGTHSKHALIRNNKIDFFLTHMTGEVFALLRDRSILGRLMAERKPNLDAFEDGLRRARQPSGLLHHVFGVRTRALMTELDPEYLPDYLSGILIGHELSGSSLAPPVLIVGEPTLSALYKRALAYFGTEAELISADVATARGLHAIAKLVEREHL